jgi:hypothetical protein
VGAIAFGRRIVEREHEPIARFDDVDGDAQQHPRE